MLKSGQRIHESVRKAYGRIASAGTGCCGPQSSCCGGGRADDVAKGVGYSDAELATLPEADIVLIAIVGTAR